MTSTSSEWIARAQLFSGIIISHGNSTRSMCTAKLILPAPSSIHKLPTTTRIHPRRMTKLRRTGSTATPQPPQIEAKRQVLTDAQNTQGPPEAAARLQLNPTQVQLLSKGVPSK